MLDKKTDQIFLEISEGKNLFNFRTDLLISRKEFLNIIGYNYSDESLRTWEYGINKPPINLINDIKSKYNDLITFSDKKFLSGIRSGRVPHGAWKNKKWQRKGINYMMEKENIIDFEDLYKIPEKTFKKYLIKNMIQQNYKSKCIALNEIIPEHTFYPWKFQQVARGFWDQKKNLIEYLSWVEKEKNINSPEGWYDIQRKDISSLHGGALFHKYNNVMELAKEIHPDYNFLPWRFSVTPKDFDFADNKNMRSIVHQIAQELDYKFPDDYYKITQDDFGKISNHVKNHYNGHTEMLKIIFPEIKWREWLFGRTPNNYWHNEDNIKKYVEWLKMHLDIKSQEEWYEISIDMIRANNGEGVLFQTGKGEPSRNVYDILSITYPEVLWEEELFGEISKEQRRLFRLLKKIYPNEKLLFNRRYPWLKNPKTGYWLELDFYFPDLGFAVEHQGEQHFIWRKNFLMTEKEFYDLQDRDKIKLEICNQRGIKLVYTTHEWDGRINTLKKILKNSRVYYN